MDPCEDGVVLRGVNELVPYLTESSPDKTFDEIVKTHANTTRLYWLIGGAPGDLDKLLASAEAHQLLPVVYALNPDPNPGTPAVTTAQQAVEYWTRDDVVAVLRQHEAWLILALREKLETNNETSEEWGNAMDEAVRHLRQAGIQVPIAIDIPNSGTDLNAMIEHGAERLQNDANVLLNVNWGLADTGMTGDDLIASFDRAFNKQLPVMLGEISRYTHQQNYSCATLFDYVPVLSSAARNQVSWMFWSWGGAKNDCSELDMTTAGTYDTLNGWADDVVHSTAYGLTGAHALPNKPRVCLVP